MKNESGLDLAEEKCVQLARTRGTMAPSLYGVIECQPPEWIPFLAVGKCTIISYKTVINVHAEMQNAHMAIRFQYRRL